VKSRLSCPQITETGLTYSFILGLKYNTHKNLKDVPVHPVHCSYNCFTSNCTAEMTVRNLGAIWDVKVKVQSQLVHRVTFHLKNSPVQCVSSVRSWPTAAFDRYTEVKKLVQNKWIIVWFTRSFVNRKKRELKRMLDVERVANFILFLLVWLVTKVNTRVSA